MVQARTYEVPLPPALTAYLSIRIAGKRPIQYVTDKGRDFIEEFVRCVECQYPDAAPFAGRLKVEAIVHYNRLAAYDIDNRLKALLDAGTHAGIWEDDSQIDHLTISRGKVIKPEGSCLLYVTDLS